MSERVVTYRIEHVRDLLRVPPSRIAACLADLLAWYQYGTVFFACAKHTTPEVNLSAGAFVWHDDGKVGGPISVTVNGRALGEAFSETEEDVTDAGGRDGE